MWSQTGRKGYADSRGKQRLSPELARDPGGGLSAEGAAGAGAQTFRISQGGCSSRESGSVWAAGVREPLGEEHPAGDPLPRAQVSLGDKGVLSALLSGHLSTPQGRAEHTAGQRGVSPAQGSPTVLGLISALAHRADNTPSAAPSRVSEFGGPAPGVPVHTPRPPYSQPGVLLCQQGRTRVRGSVGAQRPP